MQYLDMIRTVEAGGPGTEGLLRILRAHGIKCRLEQSYYVGYRMLSVQKGKRTVARKLLKVYNYI